MKLTRRDIEHLAALARIELGVREEEKLLGDLQKIVDHFKELEKIDTADVVPMAGGTAERNVFRKDEPEVSHLPDIGLADAFPEQESGFLKIPPVFE
jgi:aspartyl-tRNA(Asn)/glutamyl-tRNA(Gln) amidotransferase subunit C